ncbi:hypothetical protein SAMN05444266_101426 [Chitinophaga jiangningensis]|uniref:Outer membrane protein beta-barrel domain-containing protein n=1 Tax=Chitinophaga jiangningensis TaxID=1419482 RepID=A0A1M6W000_9BACT|nr:hypothetical protein [Chitinophaga jiangningensis]SHK86916.1 hypothetical protein SAMN05444266_101426 [Chitinophaga jiangningensis]
MKKLLLGLFLMAGIQSVNAQYYQTDPTRRQAPNQAPAPAQQKGFDPNRLIVGGAIGAVFGDYTNVNISPLVGYRFNDYIAAGANINAQYGQIRYRDFYDVTTERDTYTIFGGGVWGRVYPIPQLFLHVQPEYNGVSEKTTVYDVPNIGDKYTYKSNYGVPSLLLGAGYTQGVGGRVGISFSVLYDVLQDDRSPYNNQLIYRAGVGLGF